jgi:hypothetical protein
LVFTLNSLRQLALILSGIKVALRSGYQAVGSHAPFFKAADLYALAPASRPYVSAD